MAVMFSPASVEPRLKKLQTRCVWLKAFGIARSRVERFGKLHHCWNRLRQRFQQDRCRRDRNPPVDDRHAVFAFKLIGKCVQPLAHFHDSVVNPLVEGLAVTIHTILEIDAQRDRTDVKMLVHRHLDRFKDLFDRYSHIMTPLFCVGVFILDAWP
jgi:hypothetical protein